MILDNKTILQNFLTAVKKFTPDFLTNWAVSKYALKQKLDFYKTIKKFQWFFRLSELSQLSSNYFNTFTTTTL